MIWRQILFNRNIANNSL